MSSPNNPTEAIAYLQGCSASAPVLCDAMSHLFTLHPDWAPVLVPVYARYLGTSEFQRLAQQFPTLSNLLMVYNRIAVA